MPHTEHQMSQDKVARPVGVDSFYSGGIVVALEPDTSKGPVSHAVQWKYLVLRRQQTGDTKLNTEAFVAPRRSVKPNEDLERAARIELADSLSLDNLALVSNLGECKHVHNISGVNEEEQITWFLFKCDKNAAKIKLSKKGEYSDYEWVNFEEAKDRLGPVAYKKILEKAETSLKKEFWSKE